MIWTEEQIADWPTCVCGLCDNLAKDCECTKEDIFKAQSLAWDRDCTENQSLRQTISTLETAFNEARREAKQAKEWAGLWKHAAAHFRMGYKYWQEQYDVGTSFQWRKRTEAEQRANELQAEVERRNIVIIGLVELVTVIASTLGKKGYHELADMIGRYLEKYCPHWQPKEGGE
jgi:hypothetical protein